MLEQRGAICRTVRRDDHGIKADLKVTNWSQALESFRFVARNVAPGHFWLRRVWQLMGVLSRGPEGAREVVVTRCERGADIARMLGFPDDTAQAIRALDEHWDGAGQPYNLKGDSIPFLARILGLAQTAEVFFDTHGIEAAFDMADRTARHMVRPGDRGGLRRHAQGPRVLAATRRR